MYIIRNYVIHSPNFAYNALNAEKLQDLSIFIQLVGDLQSSSSREPLSRKVLKL